MQGSRPSKELNATGVSKYSDFGPIEGYRKRKTGSMVYGLFTGGNFTGGLFTGN